MEGSGPSYTHQDGLEGVGLGGVGFTDHLGRRVPNSFGNRETTDHARDFLLSGRGVKSRHPRRRTFLLNRFVHPIMEGGLRGDLRRCVIHNT